MINMRQRQKIQTAKVNTSVIRKEQDVRHGEEDLFWKAFSKKALLEAWEKEDEVWDKKSNELSPINKR